MRRLRYGSYPDIYRHRMIFKNMEALEIGGPSGIFGDDGSLPVYRLLRRVDNCLFSSRTMWTGDVKEGDTYQYHKGKRSGTQFICEGASLEGMLDSSYDVVLSSHCIEHMANPLQSLEGWKRILKTSGRILLVLPHRDATFDWRRPITTIEHMIQDYEKNTGEDDLTHLPEVLELHDLSRDKAAGSREEFERRCHNNGLVRGMHHHVFNTRTAIELMDCAGIQILDVCPFTPNSIALLGEKSFQGVDNSDFVSSNAAFIERSPFPSDHLKSGKRLSLR